MSAADGVGVVYVNGRFYGEQGPHISVFDQGFLFGDGVFETMLVSAGYIFKAEAHLDRLFQSAAGAHLKVPMDRETLMRTFVETVRRSGLRDAYLKCIVTSGVGKKPLVGNYAELTPTVVVFAVPYASVIAHDGGQVGITLISSAIQKGGPAGVDARVKSLNYLPNMMMRRQALSQGAHGVVSYDRDGAVTEGATENLFVVEDGELATPHRGILEGITRATVFEIATEFEIPCRAKRITRYDLLSAQEVFLCSTAGGIFPVGSIDGFPIGDGCSGPVTQKISRAYQDMLNHGKHGTPVF